MGENYVEPKTVLGSVKSNTWKFFKFRVSGADIDKSFVHCKLCLDGGEKNRGGQKSGNNFHFFRHILSCTAKTSEYGVKNYIWQFKHTLGLSFCQQNVFDKLNIFLRYHQMKVQK